MRESTPSETEMLLCAQRDSGASQGDPGWTHEARTRLKAFVGALGLLGTVGLGLSAIGPNVLGLSAACCQMAALMHLALVAFSVLLYVIVDRGRLSWTRSLDLVSVFVILSSLAVAFGEQGHGHEGVSLVSILLLLFPLFVPMHVGRTLLVSLAGASTLPLAMWLFHRATGSAWEASGGFAIAMTYLVALVAVVPAKIVWAMSKAVRRAQRLGSYELVERVGDGGMGEVWKAQHRLLRRPAAIKMIRPERLGGDAKHNQRVIERFEREAQATASLESTHTVQLYDYGVSAEGVLFHVMELLRGIDLESLVQRFGPLPPERVVHLLLQALDSLDDAHRAGLVHRDIKPANLFVSRLGRRVDFLKVLDFGLVKQRRSADVSLTGDGELTGTPAYLAPEMAVGDTEVDGRADLYALGCVAYWLLTGERVFDGPTPMKIAVAHVTETPEPPSKRLGQPLPADLESLVMACLEKDPKRRPESAALLASQLESVRLGHRWTETRARAWWARNLPELADGLEVPPAQLRASA